MNNKGNCVSCKLNDCIIKLLVVGVPAIFITASEVHLHGSTSKKSLPANKLLYDLKLGTDVETRY